MTSEQFHGIRGIYNLSIVSNRSIALPVLQIFLMYRNITITSRTHLFNPKRTFVNPAYFRLFSSSNPAMAPSAISQAVTKDYAGLGEYYKNIINAKDHETATRWQNQFTWELARHSIGEELVVYPAFVPTRSHPSAPDKPPFETVVGLMAAPIDHLADLLRRFPDQTVFPNSSTK